MTEYDAHLFDPPAPVARVTLRHAASGAKVGDVPMLLDTGSDISLLPRAFVERLGLDLKGEQTYELMGFDGSRSFAPCAQLETHFSSCVFKGQYAVIDQEYGIIGRNVLNRITLVLDGVRMKWVRTET